MKKNLFNRSVINFALIFFSLLINSSCVNNAEKSSTGPQEIHIDTPVLVKPPSSYPDTLLITSSSAVFFIPDSAQLEKIRIIYEKNIFESMVHENFYQMRNARIILKKYWPQINIVETSKARYLLFIKAGNTKTYIDLDRQRNIYGIYIFDPGKEPELIDMMNIDTMLGFYFKK